MAIFQRGSPLRGALNAGGVAPLRGALNAGGVGTNRNCRGIAGYRLMIAAMRTTSATIHRVVYRTDDDASVNLCFSQSAWTTTTKRRERNRIYFYAAVNVKRNLHSTYCTAEANY